MKSKTSYLIAIGPAQNIAEANGTFDMTPSQYTNLTQLGYVTKAELLICAVFDTAKFSDKKPLPSLSSTVKASFLTQTLPDTNNIGKPDMFVISVDQVNFLNTSKHLTSQSQCMCNSLHVKSLMVSYLSLWTADAQNNSGKGQKGK